MTHICIGKLSIIGSDNGLLPGRRQAIIWTNGGILLIEHLKTNFSEILIQIHIFSFKKMYLKLSSAKWWPFCLGLNVLMIIRTSIYEYMNKAGNSLTLRQIGCHFADDPFKCIFFSEKVWLLFKQSDTKPNLVAKVLATKFGVFFAQMVTKVGAQVWGTNFGFVPDC